MSFETCRLQVLRLLKAYKKLMSARTAEQFSLNVMLVLHGLKDAYMLESVSCDPATAKDILTNIRKICGIETGLVLIVIDTGDIIIALKDRVMDKILKLSEEDWALKVIDVNGKIPELCSMDRLNEFREKLISHTVPLKNACLEISECVIYNAHIDADVGYVLFAGWCLGYPFVYHFVPGEETYCSALSMQVLEKVCLLADIEGILSPHPFLEFTIPTDVLGADGGAEDSFLRLFLESFVADVTACARRSDAPTAVPLLRVLYESSVYRIPHVIL